MKCPHPIPLPLGIFLLCVNERVTKKKIRELIDQNPDEDETRERPGE